MGSGSGVGLAGVCMCEWREDGPAWRLRMRMHAWMHHAARVCTCACAGTHLHACLHAHLHPRRHCQAGARGAEQEQPARDHHRPEDWEAAERKVRVQGAGGCCSCFAWAMGAHACMLACMGPPPCSPACAALRVQRQGGQAPCIAQAWCPPSLQRARRGLQTSRPSVRLPRRGAASGMEEGWMVVMMMRRRGATARMRRCQVWGWGVAAVRRKSARALARGQVCVAGPAD